MRLLIAALAMCSAAGCTGVFARMTAEPLSYGDHGTGLLFGRSSLPSDGDGYAVPAAWRTRNALFTTTEVQAALTRSFALVNRLHPGSVAFLGDISRKGGGAAPGHGSHRNGRDVDIFFYAVDEQGRPLAAHDAMLKFNSRGQAVAWSPPFGHKPPKQAIPQAFFDVKRTWALVRALLTDPAVEIQWIFIQKDLGRLVVAQAMAEGEQPDLLAKAEELLRQPGDSAPHDDHLHIRFYCDPGHRAAGCVDRGPQRWLKKYWKYLPAARPPATEDAPLLSEADASGGG